MVYWTAERLARLAWEFLYSEVSLEKKLGYGVRQASKAQRRVETNVTGTQAKLAGQLRIAEELTPTANLREFYVDHQRHAQILVAAHHVWVLSGGLTWACAALLCE